MWEQYEILKSLAEGAHGKVYLAEQKFMDRRVAIKTLCEPLALDETSRERFKREASIASSLDHPNIAKVYAFGFTPDSKQAYIAMEFIDGQTLAAFLQENGNLDLDSFRIIFLQILSALEYAHARGIIHRDIKPENIMLVQTVDKLDVKILDFGIAKSIDSSAGKLTASGLIVGTPLYMSPEQCSSAPCDPRSDIYSLGCVMFQALCGRTPFAGENAAEIILKHLNEKPAEFCEINKNLKLPKALLDLIYACLSKEPAGRPQSAQVLRQSLESACAQEPTRIARNRKEKKSVLLVLLSGICVSLLFVVGTRISTEVRRYIAAERKAEELRRFDEEFLKIERLKQQADELLLGKRFSEAKEKLLTIVQLSKELAVPEAELQEFNRIMCDSYFKLADQVSHLAAESERYREYLEKCIACARIAFGEKSEEFAKVQYDLADRLSHSGRFPEFTESLLKNLIAYRQDQFKDVKEDFKENSLPWQIDDRIGARFIRLAAAKTLLGTLRFNQHKDAESIESYRESLDLLRKAAPLDVQAVWARSLICYPLAKTNAGSADAMLAEFLESVDESVSGVCAEDRQIMLTNLAEFYGSRKEFKREQKVLNSLVKYSELDFGENSKQSKEARRLFAENKRHPL